MYQAIQTKIYPTFSDYVGCLKNEIETSHERRREIMGVEQESQKAYYDRRLFGLQYEISDLVMVFNPAIETDQTNNLNLSTVEHK